MTDSTNTERARHSTDRVQRTDAKAPLSEPPIEIMANVLILAGADLGDERSTLDALQRSKFGAAEIESYHSEAVERARVIKKQMETME